MEDSTAFISNGSIKQGTNNINNCINKDIKVYVEPCKIDFFKEKFNQCYPMYKNPRGQCLIINIYQIDGMPPRRWSDRDTIALKQLFEQLLFVVNVYTDSTHDLNSENFKKIVKQFSMLNEHKNAQSTVICLMSHGEEGYLTTKEGDKVLLDDIFTMFNNKNCPNLAGKPKLFFIQSCRDDPINGPAEDLGIHLSFKTQDELDKSDNNGKTDENDGGSLNYSYLCSDNNRKSLNLNTSEISLNEKISSNKQQDGTKLLYHIPSLCDMLIGFPTQKGYIAYRKPEIGSWYMNAIVQIFSKHSHDTDLCAMLNMVNSLISGEVTNTGKKQMSEYTSKLTKPYFYFFPGLANDEEDANDDSNEQIVDYNNENIDKTNSNNNNKKLKRETDHISQNYLSISDQSDNNYEKNHKSLTCINNTTDQKLNQDHIEFISDKAGINWKYLAREMNFSESEIYEIDKKNLNNSNKSKLKYVLNKWITNHNFSSSINENNNISINRFLKILTTCRLNKLKEEFMNRFNV